MPNQQSESDRHIRSLSEYLQRITDITSEEQKDRSQALFYRGHADSSWELKPAVYRDYKEDGKKKSYRDVELQLYQEMLRRSPQSFRDCKTTFERLVKMQHYGLPTRLLDITQSPLVALYFACREKNEGNNSCDGAVLVIKTKKEDVYFQESLPSNTLSEFDFQYQVRDVLTYISRQYIHKITELGIIIDNIKIDKGNFKKDIKIKTLELLDLIEKSLSIDDEKILYSHVSIFIDKHYFLIQEIVNKSNRDDLLLDRNKLIKFLAKFSNMDKEILQKTSDKYNINISSIKSILAFVTSLSEKRIIYPPLNNERIQRQQGAFILFPRYHFNDKELNFESIIIAKNKKTAILDELKTIGISHAYLFPELDEQAKDIKNNIYPPTEIQA